MTKQRLTNNQKRAILERWSSSSLSQHEFCQQENISTSAFHHWRHLLSNELLNKSPEPESDDWIELNNTQSDELEALPEQTSSWNVELVLPGNVILRLRY